MSSILKIFLHVLKLLQKIFDVLLQNLMRMKVKVKVKVSPLQAMKTHEGCGCKDQHIHEQEAGWLVLRSATFTSGTHFIGG